MEPETTTLDGWREPNWFVIHSKSGRETLAAAGVAELDAEVFLPRIKREQPVGGVWRAIARPLFPGYFFAYFRPLLTLDSVRSVRGVLRVVGAGRCPIPLAENVILEIRQRVQEDGFICLEPQSFAAGDRVLIDEGPFAGWIGRVEREWDDHKRVAILLEALQQSRMLVEKRTLSLLAH